MADVVLFKPKAELSSQTNLQNFINLCRDELTAFGSDCWEENQWNCFYGKSNRKVVARFSTVTKPSTNYEYEPMSKPFIHFAKAYIRYSYSMNPISNLQRHMEALRVIEETLLLTKGSADITKIDGSDLDALDGVMRGKFTNSQSINKVGYQVEMILGFCRSNCITPSLPEWSNPFSKPKELTILLNEEGKEHRSNKMPSNEEMMILANLFHDAPKYGKEAVYYTSIMALLMVAPSRASELFSLSVDCLVWENDSAGRPQLGIRWNPAKGGNAGLKWVPSVMHDVVVEAVERLVKLGEAARKAAKLAEKNPNEFMQHEYCVGRIERDDAPLTVEQVNGAMGLSINTLKPTKEKTKWLLNLLNEDLVLTYRRLGLYSYKKYVSAFNNWPHIDAKGQTKVSEALLLHREHEFHKDFKIKGFSFVMPTVNDINSRISETGARSEQSLWHKLGLKLSNGEPVALTSHKARHWLSTLSERGGMDELTLANWAGRAKVSDNRKYDHRTEEEKSEASRALLISEDANALQRIQANLPVRYEDIGKNQFGVALVTELGVCEHDFAMMPCQRSGDCETCKELVCIKGYSSSLELLRKREAEVSEQFQRAVDSHQIGAFGADRWVSSLGWRLSHLRTKIRMLEDDRMPDGAALRIPEQFDPSPIKVAMLEKGLDTEVKKPDSITLDDDVYKLLGF